MITSSYDENNTRLDENREYIKNYHENGTLKSEYIESYIKDSKGIFGLIKYYYDDGKLHFEKNYTGLLDGVTKEYYKDGTLKSVKTYKRPLLDCCKKSYLLREEVYKDNKIVSEKDNKMDLYDSKFYYKKEKKESFISNIKNKIKTTFLKDEIKKEYYSNGNLKFEAPYSNGVENGIVKGYYESGELLFTQEYKDGKGKGKEVKYLKNGKKVN
jgi:antitoxin component YwqK of YwqJK toxin-antitoxin module